MEIHIVDSVKGGAGKSTFSCKLALYLLRGANRTEKTNEGKYRREDDSTEEQPKVCIIDVDLLGTSWEYTFKSACEHSSTTGSNDMIYLNDLINDFDHYKNSNFIQNIKLHVDPFDEETIEVIFCNPSQSAKNRFKLTAETTVPDIEIDQFKYSIKKLVDKLAKENYDHVIFDMPPNSDPYSDTIIQIYMNHKQNKYAPSLYVVSSYDIAHIESTMEWYDKFKRTNDSLNTVQGNHHLPRTLDKIKEKNAKPKWRTTEKKKFFVVLNNTSGMEKINNPESIFESFPNQEYNYDDYAYLLIDYDPAYSKSKERKLTANNTDIRVSNSIDLDNFYIFSELKNH